MRNVYGKDGVSTVDAVITPDSVGGFLAIASTSDLDRDGEIIAPGAFLDEKGKLPESVPIHLDHVMTAKGVIGRGKPFYQDGLLMLDAKFDAGSEAQEIRRKVIDGTLDSLSIVFLGTEWDESSGTRTLVKGQLLAVDLVSIPSNSGARILSMRSVQGSYREMVREVTADALLTLARAEIADAKRLGYGRAGPTRRKVDAALHDVLDPITDLYPNRRRSL